MQMRLALEEARQAGRAGNLAVGAVITLDGAVLAKAGNQVRTSADPTAHAEIAALRILRKNYPSVPLAEATLYTTFEPCPMCLGACLLEDVGAIVIGGSRQTEDRTWGGYTPKALIRMATPPGAPPRIQLRAGPFADECAAVRASTLH